MFRYASAFVMAFTVTMTLGSNAQGIQRSSSVPPSLPGKTKEKLKRASITKLSIDHVNHTLRVSLKRVVPLKKEEVKDGRDPDILHIVLNKNEVPGETEHEKIDKIAQSIIDNRPNAIFLSKADGTNPDQSLAEEVTTALKESAQAR